MIRGFRCKYDIDEYCEADKCDKCIKHPMYQQGRADGFTESINILKGLDKQIAEIFENIVRNSEHYNCNNCEVR